MIDKTPLTRHPSVHSESVGDGNAVQHQNPSAIAGSEIAASNSKSPNVHSQPEPSEQDPGLKILLIRMDTAFSEYARESEQLSVLLSKSKSLPGWSAYHELLRQRTAEVVAHEQYRRIQDELFKRIVPPSVDEKPDTKFSWMIARAR
jgi:hypothetical protein